MLFGGVAIYIEKSVPYGTKGASIHQNNFYLFLALIGIFVWARIIFDMITIPRRYLQTRSLISLDPQIYGRRERAVQGLGYTFGIVTILFAIYKIFLLWPHFLNS